MTALARRGYNQAAIEAEQARLDAVTQTNSAHETAKAAAVRATTDRDAAAKALDDWWAEFRAVAQVALKDRPDLWLCWVYNKKPPADAPSAGGLTSCPSKSKLVLESCNITAVAQNSPFDCAQGMLFVIPSRALCGEESQPHDGDSSLRSE